MSLHGKKSTVNSTLSGPSLHRNETRVFLVDGRLEYAHAAITTFVTTIKLSAGFRCHRGKQSGSVVSQVNAKCITCCYESESMQAIRSKAVLQFATALTHRVGKLKVSTAHHLPPEDGSGRCRGNPPTAARSMQGRHFPSP